MPLSGHALVPTRAETLGFVTCYPQMGQNTKSGELTRYQIRSSLAAIYSPGVLQYFLIELLHNPRLVALFWRTWSNATSPFGALDLGFDRLVVEAAPYIVDPCWSFVAQTCLLRTRDPSGKKVHAEQSYCHNHNCSA